MKLLFEVSTEQLESLLKKYSDGSNVVIHVEGEDGIPKTIYFAESNNGIIDMKNPPFALTQINVKS